MTTTEQGQSNAHAARIEGVHPVFSHVSEVEFLAMVRRTCRFVLHRQAGSLGRSLVEAQWEDDLVSETAIMTLVGLRNSRAMLEQAERPTALMCWHLRRSATRVFWNLARAQKRWTAGGAVRSLDGSLLVSPDEGSSATLHDVVGSGLPSPLTLLLAAESLDVDSAIFGPKLASPIRTHKQATRAIQKARRLFESGKVEFPERRFGETRLRYAARVQALAEELRREGAASVERTEAHRAGQRARTILVRCVQQGLFSEADVAELKEIECPFARVRAIESLRARCRAARGYGKPGPKPVPQQKGVTAP